MDSVPGGTPSAFDICRPEQGLCQQADHSRNIWQTQCLGWKPFSLVRVSRLLVFVILVRMGWVYQPPCGKPNCGGGDFCCIELGLGVSGHQIGKLWLTQSGSVDDGDVLGENFSVQNRSGYPANPTSWLVLGGPSFLVGIGHLIPNYEVGTSPKHSST